ncbi:hypothetical protein MYMA111404_02235 [Mycoplasma marinum]|nr:hypothetical protein [Mycoplasma marinum]
MISEIIDNKLKKLTGLYTYADLLRELKDTFIPYTKMEAMNFLRQSVYRLKKEGIIFKEDQKTFNFNSGKVYKPKEKESLNLLMDENLTSWDISTLLNEYGVITQVPAYKTIVVQKRFAPVRNDVLGAKYKYTNFEFDKSQKIYFELAKIFEELSNGENEYKTFYKILLNKSDVKKSVTSFKKYLNPKYIKRYTKFSEWVKRQSNREW